MNQNTLAGSELSGTLVENLNSDKYLQSSLHGPVAIFWDIENCPIPSDVRPEDVSGHILMALRVHPIIKGAITVFSAYGDFNAIPRRLREGCQRTGVTLVDVPNGRKDAADKAILVDMFLFALDNRPPSSIMLISGDVDFAPALHILGQRGYTVFLVIPSWVGVSSALINAGRFVWDWLSVARGEGFVPPGKTPIQPHVGPNKISGYITRCSNTENPDSQNEEAIVYRGVSQSYYNSRDFSMVSEYTTSNSSIKSRSLSVPCGLNKISPGPTFSGDRNESVMWVQPGDLNGLKRQLVKLLEISGGALPFARVSTEYLKVFGRPLYVYEYGAMKLLNLLKKMGDSLVVEGNGLKKFVYLQNMKAGSNAPSPVVSLKNNTKGKEVLKENMDIASSGGGGSSEECSDDGEVVGEGKCGFFNQNLEQFKYELQEILVSYSCRIFLVSFEAIYQQRYKKSVDYKRFSVNDLEDLFDKVRDVVALHEEPVSKRKFLVAVGG